MTATGYFLLPAPLTRMTAAITLECKTIADDGLFEGYASLFNREDLSHDVVQPGAFRDSLAGRDAGAIKMLFQHNPAEPIGIWEEIREDGRGLYVRGRLMTAVAKAREVLALMRAGALDGLSIGFKAVKARRDAQTGIRRIEKADLWEISIVTFPMLPGARVMAVKQRAFASHVPREREFERWLTRDAGLTRSEAKAVLRDGFKGLLALRDAGRSIEEDAHLAARLRVAAGRLRDATGGR